MCSPPHGQLGDEEETAAPFVEGTALPQNGEVLAVGIVDFHPNAVRPGTDDEFYVRAGVHDGVGDDFAGEEEDDLDHILTPAGQDLA